MKITVQIADPNGVRLDAGVPLETDAVELGTLLLSLEMGRTRQGRLRPVQTLVATDEHGHQATYTRAGKAVVADLTGETVALSTATYRAGQWLTCSSCDRTTSTVKNHRTEGARTTSPLCRDCVELEFAA